MFSARTSLSMPVSRLPDYLTSDLFSSWIIEEWITSPWELWQGFCSVGIYFHFLQRFGLLVIPGNTSTMFFFRFHLCLCSSLNTNKWRVIVYVLRGQIFGLQCCSSWLVRPDSLCRGKITERQKNMHLYTVGLFTFINQGHQLEPSNKQILLLLEKYELECLESSGFSYYWLVQLCSALRRKEAQLLCKHSWGTFKLKGLFSGAAHNGRG